MRKIVRKVIILLFLVLVLSINVGFSEMTIDNTPVPSIEEQTETILIASLEQTNLIEKILQQKELFKKQLIEEQLRQEELHAIISVCNIYCDSSEIYFVDTPIQYTDEEKQLLAQCLFCEAGSTSWECQVITLSAILTHCDDYGGLWVLDSVNHFAVAPYYRYKTPQEEQYKVVEYVLSGHRIADIKYFRTQYYHGFGTEMLNIDGVYFSK